MSVIDENTPYELKSLSLEKPEVHIVILEDGTSNWDIGKIEEAVTDKIEENEHQEENTQEDYKTEEESPFTLKVNSVEINNGIFTYDDHSSKTFVEIVDMDQTLSGDISANIYDVVTELNACLLYTSPSPRDRG